MRAQDVTSPLSRLTHLHFTNILGKRQLAVGPWLDVCLFLC